MTNKISMLITLIKLIKSTFKWVFLALVLLGVVTAILYSITEPKQSRNWIPAHARLASIELSGDKSNPLIDVNNVRDFQWQDENPERYQAMQFQLDDIVELTAVVSHFSAISEIAHVFMTFVLNDGRELGVSIEARRERGEAFSIQGGLLGQFELIYVLATPEDLLGIRRINQEKVHVYPIKETKQKAQEMFLLIANEVEVLSKEPELYHLFFKNCTNQLVKHVSILTQEKYPWYFQTLAPGLAGLTLYELGLIDLPDTGFEDIQEITLLKY